MLLTREQSTEIFKRWMGVYRMPDKLRAKLFEQADTLHDVLDGSTEDLEDCLSRDAWEKPTWNNFMGAVTVTKAARRAGIEVPIPLARIAEPRHVLAGLRTLVVRERAFPAPADLLSHFLFAAEASGPRVRAGAAGGSRSAKHSRTRPSAHLPKELFQKIICYYWGGV